MTVAQMVCEGAVRIRDGAVLVGPCECAGCPPICPWEVAEIWKAWGEQDWVDVYQSIPASGPLFDTIDLLAEFPEGPGVAAGGFYGAKTFGPWPETRFVYSHSSDPAGADDDLVIDGVVIEPNDFADDISGGATTLITTIPANTVMTVDVRNSSIYGGPCSAGGSLRLYRSPIGSERHEMCIRFVWLCVEQGVVRRAEIFGGTLPAEIQDFIAGLVNGLHVDVVAPFLPTPGSHLFAIEFFGYRMGVRNPLPGSPRWIRTYTSRSDDFEVYRCSDPAGIGRG